MICKGSPPAWPNSSDRSGKQPVIMLTFVITCFIVQRADKDRSTHDLQAVLSQPTFEHSVSDLNQAVAEQ